MDDADLLAMQGAPMRGFDDSILKEPNVYRTYEAISQGSHSVLLPTASSAQSPLTIARRRVLLRRSPIMGWRSRR